MARFLAETLDELVRFFMEKSILKSIMNKAHFSISLTKTDLNDVTKQNPLCLADLGFAVSYEIKLLKSKKKVTNNQLVRFEKEPVTFLAKMCTHLIEKVHYYLILPHVSHAYHQYLLQSVRTLLNLLLKKFYPNLSIPKPLLLLLLIRQNQSITSL